MPGLNVPQRGGGFWQMGQTHAQGAMSAYGSQVPERKTELNAPDKNLVGMLRKSEIHQYFLKNFNN